MNRKTYFAMRDVLLTMATKTVSTFFMKVIHISSEFAPLAKAGGLGDVLVGLVRKLTELGVDVSVIIPKYSFLPDLPLKEVCSFSCLENGATYNNTIWETWVENCHLYLLETDHPKNYFNRSQIYGEQDDIARFLYFSKACLEYVKNEHVDILHIHDWHTAISSVLAKDLFNLSAKFILTIHNAEYQGRCASWDLDAIGLKGDQYTEKLQDDQYPNTINLLKGGIIYADLINTVSPTYAKEILTPQIGGPISATFNQHQQKLSGILNGIDQTLWNPETDTYLPITYSKKGNIFESKEKIRNNLKNHLLLDTQRPWFGAISRLVHQKNPDLLEEALYQILELGGTFFLLGSSPVPSIQKHFESLKMRHKDNQNVHLFLEYNEKLAHQLYAALDFLIMPSHFEPCGLSQLIAMRYGTVPIVRKTGGLIDTVFDLEDITVPLQNRNGLVFEKSTKEDLSKVILRAMHLFKNEPEKFKNLLKQIMNKDFSWEKPSKEYLALYKKSVSTLQSY